MSHLIAARIGRLPNAAERGFQLAHERPELLEHLSRNHYCARRPAALCTVAWEEISEDLREWWRLDTLREIDAHVASYVPAQPPDDSPDPEGSLPVTSAAAYGDSPRLPRHVA